MYTNFVKDTRAVISDCWNTVKDIQTRQTKNNEVYQEDYADSENAKLEQRRKGACNAARDKINDIMNRADADAASLDEITPLDVNPGDMNYRRVTELLSGKFTLSVENLQHVIDEYIRPDDRALLNAVRTYSTLRNLKFDAATTETRRGAISEIRESALSVISKIESASYRNGERDLNTPMLVNNFCADSGFASELCGRLGQTFDGKLLKPTVGDENQFNFNFQKAERRWSEQA